MRDGWHLCKEKGDSGCQSVLGHRLQYSVFQIDNSSRIIDNVIQDLKNNFEKKFTSAFHESSPALPGLPGH